MLELNFFGEKHFATYTFGLFNFQVRHLNSMKIGSSYNQRALNYQTKRKNDFLNPLVSLARCARVFWNIDPGWFVLYCSLFPVFFTK